MEAVAANTDGGGAVAGWEQSRLGRAPEFGVERFPSPETRLYVK